MTTSIPPRPVSTWALAALLCSVAIFCPILTLLGPLLGVKALAEIRSRPGLGGTRLATAAIVIGLMATAGWGVVLKWWDTNVRQMMIDGPAAPLHAGLAGDYDRFRAAFYGPGAELDDVVAADFFESLSARYGRLYDISQDPSRVEAMEDDGRLSPWIPYTLHFDQGLVAADAKFILLEEDRFALVRKWSAIIVYDEEHGDLVYPPDVSREE